jgi:voltage-gated potassium channel
MKVALFNFRLLMKSLITIIMQLARDRQSRLSTMAMLRFLVFVVALVIIYSVIFHLIMEHEGRSESWVTGVYWTLTVMSTLGFGDITFESDLGKLFSIIVLISGVLFLLVLLPFTFIEFFYAPWIKAQQAARAPKELPEKTKGHVILTKFDTVTAELIEKFGQFEYPYVLVVPNLDEALRLHDQGYRVMLGELDNPNTYRQARVHQALLVASTASDQINANVAFTVREISETVPIVATANSHASVDILQLAGCSYVLQLGRMMGQALARQVAEGATTAHVVGRYDDLLIVEAVVRGTSLVGQTLRETRLREQIGINVLGVWERGVFQTATADTRIDADMILVMAGSEQHVAAYNARFQQPVVNRPPIMIIGGGRVGRTAGEMLSARGIDYRIVEKSPERIRNAEHYVLGDAADLEVLEAAGIREASAIIITTHDDDMNIYLTIYCRRLRPDVQIISRADLERNIPTLHRAGADFVMSYASMGAATIVNYIGRDNILMMAEGIAIFEVPIPREMVGKTIAELELREKTGCTVVALHSGQHAQSMPDPHKPLPPGVRLILIGSPEAEERFLKMY